MSQRYFSYVLLEPVIRVVQVLVFVDSALFAHFAGNNSRHFEAAEKILPKRWYMVEHSGYYMGCSERNPILWTTTRISRDGNPITTTRRISRYRAERAGVGVGGGMPKYYPLLMQDRV